MLEARLVTRSAMKPSSGKSALEGDVTAGKSMELAGEMLTGKEHVKKSGNGQPGGQRIHPHAKRPRCFGMAGAQQQ